MTQRRHALITGASRGIGAATAAELGRRGFHVVLDYRHDGTAAADVVRQFERMGGSAQALAADVTDPAAVAE